MVIHMQDPFENLKRIKIFDEFFMAFSNNKIIFKDLNNPKNHKTMKFTPTGILDVHDTQEGSKKEYDSGGKYDLLKSVVKMAVDPQGLMDPLIKTVQMMRPVSFTEKEFEHLKVWPFLTKEELMPFIKFNKRKIEFPTDTINVLNPMNNLISWKDAKSKIKEFAEVFDGNTPCGLIFKNKNGAFYLPVSDITKTPLLQFFDKMLDLEPIDGKFSDKENELRKKTIQQLHQASNQYENC